MSDDLDPEIEAQIDAAIEADLRDRAGVEHRAIAAADEHGAVVLNVWCQKCRGRQPLATVRRSSAGMVFDSVSPSAVDVPLEVTQARVKALRGRGSRSQFIVAGRCVVLLDDPGRDDDGSTVCTAEWSSTSPTSSASSVSGRLDLSHRWWSTASISDADRTGSVSTALALVSSPVSGGISELGSRARPLRRLAYASVPKRNAPSSPPSSPSTNRGCRPRTGPHGPLPLELPPTNGSRSRSTPTVCSTLLSVPALPSRPAKRTSLGWRWRQLRPVAGRRHEWESRPEGRPPAPASQPKRSAEDNRHALARVLTAFPGTTPVEWNPADLHGHGTLLR